MAICGRIFAVTFLQTYMTNRQGYDVQERFMIEWKTAKVFPRGHYAIYSIIKTDCKKKYVAN